MDEIEFNPRALPQPSCRIPDDIRGVIPEFSLTLNDSRTPKKQLCSVKQFVSSRDNSSSRQDTPKSVSALPAKYNRTTVERLNSVPNEYPEDMRLKFYQKLQNKVDNSEIRPRQSVEMPLALKESPPRQNTYDPSLIPRPSNFLFNQSPKPTSNHNENDSIRQLFKLVEKQNQKIESLKLEIKMLQAINHNNEMERLLECEKIKKMNQIENKENHKQISIGVMTSFELNTQKSAKNCVEKGINTSYRADAIEVGINTEKSPEKQLKKIIENIPISQSNQSIPAIYSNVEKNIFDDQKYLENEAVKPTPSAKVGWTFYNNVLCQVNEILHDSTDNHESKRSLIPDTTQKCTTKQVKIIETTITTGVASGIESPSLSNKMPVDSSYYPRVNYHGGIMQSSHSISDTNASIHMKALALKYLGNKYQPEGPAYKRGVEFLSNFVADNTSPEYSASLGTRNYVDKYHLAADKPSSPLRNWNDSQSNILDMSVLKRQPKLL